LQALEAATAQLFAQPAPAKRLAEQSTRAQIEALLAGQRAWAEAVAAGASQQQPPRYPPELQMWCAGLRTKGCTFASPHHEQFHAVTDPRTLDATPWPEAVPALEPAVRAAVGSLQRLCSAVVRLVAPGGLEARRAEAAEARGDNSVLDLLSYRAGAGCGDEAEDADAGPGGGPNGTCGALFAEGQPGMKAHVDPGLLTCKYVSPSQVPGLQLRDRASDTWLSEAAFTDELLCFPNQLLADWCI
jgi:isopenicillin N synthase-like dioxygenase